MKKFLLSFLFIIFTSINIACSETISMQWLNEDGTIYDTTTCNAGDDVILPTTPTKRGYTFMGWKPNYEPIEYLESTGTQYIDTGFAYDSSVSNMPFKMDFTIAFVKYINSDNYYATLSGAIVNNGSRIMTLVQYKYNNEYFLISNSSNNQSIFSCAGVPNLQEPIHIVYITNPATSTQRLYVNDCTTESANTTNPTSSKSLWLFKSNGSYANWNNNWPMRIYRWSFESNGVKIRDFIPVLDVNGVACMYDKVEKKFYYNAGIGDFIAGPVISEQ